MNHKEWQEKKIENHGEKAKNQDTKKIYLPRGGVVEITHDKQHSPKIVVHDNEQNHKQKQNKIKDVLDVMDNINYENVNINIPTTFDDIFEFKLKKPKI